MPGSRRNPRLGGPEDQLQISVAALLDVALLPVAFWTAFPAGMYALERAAGGRLKSYGLKPGVPDVVCLHDGRAVFIELKRPGGIVSRVQRHVHERLERAGFHVYICRSPEAVIGALVREGFPMRREVVRQMQMNKVAYASAERQAAGDLYFGKVNAGTAQSGPKEPQEGPAPPA